MYPARSQHITGRLSLVKQHGVLFLAWLPYSAGSLGQDGSFQVRSAVLARALHEAPVARHRETMRRNQRRGRYRPVVASDDSHQ